MVDGDEGPAVGATLGVGAALEGSGEGTRADDGVGEGLGLRDADWLDGKFGFR